MSAIIETTAGGRLCCSCGAANIAVARFCGNCGSRLPEETVHLAAKPRRHLAFKGVMVLAIFILMASMVMSYQLFNSTDSTKVSSMPFADVPLDHPVYRLCRNLVEIRAIGYRKILELAPYAPISAAEWNYALETAASHLKRQVAASAFFKAGETVTAARLEEKLLALEASPGKFPDTSRIRSFYHLETALFAGGQLP